MDDPGARGAMGGLRREKILLMLMLIILLFVVLEEEYAYRLVTEGVHHVGLVSPLKVTHSKNMA